MHDLQAMQCWLSKSTMPSGRVNSARVGQIVTHGASSQWLQRKTVKYRRTSGNLPFSTFLTQVRKFPKGTSCSALQATVQAWHPIQRRLSITKPYFMLVSEFDPEAERNPESIRTEVQKQSATPRAS